MPKLVATLCSLGFLYALGTDVLNADEFSNPQSLSSAEAPVHYTHIATSCEPEECEDEACEDDSIADQIRAPHLNARDKFALLAEKTDRLAETVEGLCCRDIPIDPRLENQLHNPSGGFFLTADFLYWQADEDDLAYALYTEGFSQSLPNPSTRIDNALRGLSFEWNPGFRVGIGGTFCSSDYWGLLFSFTHMRNEAHGSTNIGPLNTFLDHILVSTWDQVLLGYYATAAKARWSVNYNTEILDAYRDFFLGKHLIVRPRMGLLNANINQKYHATYTLEPNLPTFSTIPEAKMEAKCNYWGLGVRGGTDLLWHFSEHFGIYAELSAGLVYGRFNVDRDGNSESFTSSAPVPLLAAAADTPQPFTYAFKKKIWRARATIQTALGLEWETIFNRDRNRIAISLGYEFNEWFRQNQFVHSTHVSGGALSVVHYNFSNADLAFKGGTLRAIFNF